MLDIYQVKASYYNNFVRENVSRMLLHFINYSKLDEKDRHKGQNVVCRK